jgi:anti-sigma factor RsiW
MNPQADRPTDTHRAAQEALPWLLNGTLDGPELQQVREHLAACPACRADLDALRSLRAAALPDPERAVMLAEPLGSGERP